MAPQLSVCCGAGFLSNDGPVDCSVSRDDFPTDIDLLEHLSIRLGGVGGVGGMWGTGRQS